MLEQFFSLEFGNVDGETTSGNEFSIDVGHVFNCIADTKTFMTRYGQSRGLKMTTIKNDQRALKYVCSRGRFVKSTSTGKRVNNHFSFCGCKVEFRFSKRKDGSVKLTFKDESHNHDIVKEDICQYDALSEDTKKLVGDLIHVHVKPFQISQLIQKSYGVKVSTKKIENLKKKVVNSKPAESENLLKYVNEERAKGGYCCWKENENGEASEILHFDERNVEPLSRNSASTHTGRCHVSHG